jgi:hypothetical protein
VELPIMVRRRRIFRIVLLFAGGLALLALALAFLRVRAMVRFCGSINRLQQIATAMKCYHRSYGRYPPQFLTDQQGRPAHSWRVLLWPYLCADDSWKRYRFDEPWNGPHNRLLAGEMPEIYRSPFTDSKSTTTQYVGIAGKKTSWQGATAMSDTDLRCSDKEHLIWLVEAANSDIHWMEPRDIPLEQAWAGINAPGGGGIQSNYSDVLPAQVLPYGNESLPVDLSLAKFREMLTIRGSSP